MGLNGTGVRRKESSPPLVYFIGTRAHTHTLWARAHTHAHEREREREGGGGGERERGGEGENEERNACGARRLLRTLVAQGVCVRASEMNRERVSESVSQSVSR
jgi:hypothetical protein